MHHLQYPSCSADTRDMKARLVACFQASSTTVLFLSSIHSLLKSFTLDTHSLLQNCYLRLVKHTQEMVLAGLTSCETGKKMEFITEFNEHP